MLPWASFAQAQALDVTTPAISVIKKSITQRFALLEPLLNTGMVGLTHDGLLAICSSGERKGAPSPEAERLVEEENKDRNALYREIARANGHPEWEDDLRAMFGRRFIERSRAGWFHRDAAGLWHKTP